MTQQNGIDILCDAAGSDMILSSLFGLGTPAAAAAAASSTSPPGAKRVKRTPSATHKAAHICQLCNKVYERADHLTRHLRSHANARQYQCSRCHKAFNRADLLTRHESTHDRDIAGMSRAVIRRSDRAVEACVACSVSKAKCDDQKPCGRCKSRNLDCRPAARKGSAQPEHSVTSLERSSRDASNLEDGFQSISPRQSSGYPLDHGHDFSSKNNAGASNSLSDATHRKSNAAQLNPLPFPVMSDDMLYFNPMQHYFQDVDFTSFDLNFDDFVVPPMDGHGPSPQSASASTSKSVVRDVARDAQRGHAAFKRSLWLWEPEIQDYVSKEQEGLDMKEESINRSAAFASLHGMQFQKPKLSTKTRDQLYAMVLSVQKDGNRVPPFPSLGLLNYLVQAHFTHDEHQCDSFIHIPTFNPEDALPELLGSVIMSGATFVSVPAIWQFGYAMHEVLRQRLWMLFESSNANTRSLRCLQALLLGLDVGVWSGFKRKTELAESFFATLVTMIRRAGALSASEDTNSVQPTATDSPDVLESKWHRFIERESYKRLVLHMFSHDVQASMSLQKSPLMSFTELAFSLPAAQDLWRASTAEAWRDAWLRKGPLPPDTEIPLVGESMHRLGAVHELASHVDTELCYTAVLHGFWSQISAYREAVKFNQFRHQSTPHSWLATQQHELYGDLNEFSATIYASRQHMPHLTIVADLFMMILHVPLDDITRFAGKLGVEEARRAAPALEQGWVNSPDASHAVWKAGQVLANARRLPPTSIRRFNAVAVYFAGLTLWAYGSLRSWPQADQTNQPNDEYGQEQAYLMLDGEETHNIRTFLQLGRGIPALTHMGKAVSLEQPRMTLTITRNVLRDSFPVKDEPLPPLVEGLHDLLRDLMSGSTARPSRAASEDIGIETETR